MNLQQMKQFIQIVSRAVTLVNSQLDTFHCFFYSTMSLLSQNPCNYHFDLSLIQTLIDRQSTEGRPFLQVGGEESELVLYKTINVSK